jgi:hypothetical protein
VKIVLRGALDKLNDLGSHARHPCHRPWALFRKQALHVDAKMDRGRPDRVLEFTHGR